MSASPLKKGDRRLPYRTAATPVGGSPVPEAEGRMRRRSIALHSHPFRSLATGSATKFIVPTITTCSPSSSPGTVRDVIQPPLSLRFSAAPPPTGARPPSSSSASAAVSDDVSCVPSAAEAAEAASPRLSSPTEERVRHSSDSAQKGADNEDLVLPPSLQTPFLDQQFDAESSSVVFLFINPSSGGSRAAAFTRAGVQQLSLSDPHPARVYIFDIRQGPSGAKPGFQLLRKLVEQRTGGACGKQKSKNADSTDQQTPTSLSNRHASRPARPTQLGSPLKTPRDANRHTSTATQIATQKRWSQRNETVAVAGGLWAGNEEEDDDEEEEGAEIQEIQKKADSLRETQGGSATAVARRTPAGRELVRVLVAGGDGTVMWCASELWAHQVDDRQVAVGVIPYGTGNDFAKAFGWQHYGSCEPFDKGVATLRRLLQAWITADIVLHDLWDIQIEVDAANGQFSKIDSATRKKKTITEEGTIVRKMNFLMSNYFSLGVESRIGIGFDRYRTQSQACNKVRYMIEGFKKSALKRTAGINRVVKCLKDGDGGNGDDSADHTVFSTETEHAQKLPILKSAMSLIAVNIPSFGAGNNIWGPSRKVGLKVPANGQYEAVSALRQKKQSVGDSLLEFVSFPNTASLGLEFAFKGRGSRIHQGKGPFLIEFRDELKQTDRVYFQVDGEFFHMQQPKRVTIRLARKLLVLRHPV